MLLELLLWKASKIISLYFCFMFSLIAHCGISKLHLWWIICYTWHHSRLKAGRIASSNFDNLTSHPTGLRASQVGHNMGHFLRRTQATQWCLPFEGFHGLLCQDCCHVCGDVPWRDSVDTDAPWSQLLSCSLCQNVHCTLQTSINPKGLCATGWAWRFNTF